MFTIRSVRRIDEVLSVYPLGLHGPLLVQGRRARGLLTFCLGPVELGPKCAPWWSLPTWVCGHSKQSCPANLSGLLGWRPKAEKVVLALLRRVYCAPYQGDVGSYGVPVVGGDGEHGDGLAKQVLLEPDAMVAGYEQVMAIFDGVPDQVPRSERIAQFSLCSEARVAAYQSAAAGSWDGGYSPPRKRAVKPACSKCRSKASASWIWRVSMTMKLAQSTTLQL